MATESDDLVRAEAIRFGKLAMLNTVAEYMTKLEDAGTLPPGVGMEIGDWIDEQRKAVKDA